MPEGWAFFQLKTDLAARLGPREAHAVFGHVLRGIDPDTEGGAGPLHRLIDVAQEAGAQFHCHTPAQDVRLPGAPLPGGVRSPAAVAQARALFLTRLDGAVTYGRSNLRALDGRLCSDLQGNEAGRYRTLWWFDPVITARDRAPDGSDSATDILWHRPRAPVLDLPEAIDLTGALSPGWGHCVLEFAPQLLLAEALGAMAPEVPLLVDAGLPQAHYDLLRFVSGGRRPIVTLGFRQAARVGRLWAASSPEYWPVLRAPGQLFQAGLSSINPAALAGLLRHVPGLAAVDAADPGPRRVFLARAGRDRRLENHAAVQARMEAAGFVTLHPERLSFAEQLHVARHASHVAGPWGSQLMLALLFGRPGLRLLMTHLPDLEERPALTAIGEARGQRVLLVPGQVTQPNTALPYNALYTVDPAVLEAALAGWL